MNKPLFFKDYLTTFFIANLFFLLLQLIYCLTKETSYIQAMTYPINVYIELIGALLIQLLLYGALSWLQTEWLWGIYPYIRNKKILHRWQLLICLTSIAGLLSVNCFYFPMSKFSRIFLPECSSYFVTTIMYLSLSILTGLSLCSLCHYAYRYPRWTTLVAAITVFIFFIPQYNSTLAMVPQEKRPNLIIIGIDSLSPDRINPTLTPTLSHFFKNSVHFQNTISPLARTYAAWTTILTGLYPLHHFARENLYPQDSIKHSSSFAWILQKMGYQTIFASDDRRFNNLGKEFGFQKIIGPRIGVSEVLLGSFYDFPVSNLLINLRISQWILPYNYINRAGHFSYYPASFDNALQRTIAQRDSTKPIFLATHFTLPHWPYAWAISSPSKIDDEYNVTNREGIYNDAVHQADQQVNHLLQVLSNNGMLENSLLIVLSDHGEVMYKTGSRKTTAHLYQGQFPGSFANYLRLNIATDLEKSIGHGSDLLSPAQYYCLLGFKIFQHGQQITQPQSINTPVALIDIAPTIANFFKFSLHDQPDGISLLTSITTTEKPLNNRLFMLESGMLPNQLLTKQKIIEAARLLFYVNPKNGLIEIKKNQFSTINAMKLYGAIQNNWIVALYPNGQEYITVILNLHNGFWTDDLGSAFAKASPVQQMLSSLRQFYKKDLSIYPKLHAIPFNHTK